MKETNNSSVQVEKPFSIESLLEINAYLGRKISRPVKIKLGKQEKEELLKIVEPMGLIEDNTLNPSDLPKFYGIPIEFVPADSYFEVIYK